MPDRGKLAVEAVAFAVALNKVAKADGANTGVELTTTDVHALIWGVRQLRGK